MKIRLFILLLCDQKNPVAGCKYIYGEVCRITQVCIPIDFIRMRDILLRFPPTFLYLLHFIFIFINFYLWNIFIIYWGKALDYIFILGICNNLTLWMHHGFGSGDKEVRNCEFKMASTCDKIRGQCFEG